MKTVFATAFAAAIALSGCVTTPQVFAKNGITHDRYQRDAVECFAKASQSIPTNTQMGYDPIVGIYSADTNRQARAMTTQLCLRDKGYQLVTVPLCTGEAFNTARARSQSEAGRADVIQVGPQSCVVPTVGTNDLPFFWRSSPR